jgi:AraC family transcriptional activator of pobA
MKQYETIPEYYKAFGHTAPKVEYFDVRPFEQYYQEDKSKITSFDSEPFRVGFYGIGLLIQGTARSYLGKSFTANIVFYSPYQILSWSGVDNNWKGYYVMFNQDFLGRCSFSSTFLSDFPFLRLDNIHPITVPEQLVTDLMSIFEKIHAEFNSDNEDKYVMIESYLRILLHHIKRNTVDLNFGDTDTRSKAEMELLVRYTSLIENHLALNELKPEFFSPSFYAAKLNIHANHLNAVVKRATNKTAKQIIHKALITTAKSLLTQSGLSVKEIAYQLGFEEPAHFNNLFKKYTSLTPSQYRKLGDL